MNAGATTHRATGARRAVYVIAALHLAVALPLAYLLNIWADEASTLYTTEQGIRSAFANALADEKQAPLYFWVLSIWRELSGSVFFARLFSVIASVVAIGLFFDVLRRFVSERAALFVTFLFALHPFLVWASVEIRVYSTVVLLSLLLVRLWIGTFFEPEPEEVPIGAAALFFLTATTALYTNYYLGFLLAGLFAGLLAPGRWRSAAFYLLTMAATGICFAPLVLAISEQFAANTVAYQTERSLVTGLQILWNTFLTFTLPTEIFPLDQISTLSLVRVWVMRIGLIAVIFVVIRRRRDIVDPKLTALGVATATIFAFFIAAYLLLGEVYVAVRHASVIFAPLILAAAVVLLRLLPARIWPVVLAVYLGLFGYSVHALYPELAKRGDWARVGAFIASNERPGQPIVVFTTFDALALPYHYSGVNRIYPDEKYFDWEIEAPLGTPDAWRRQTAFVVSEIPDEAGEIWLVTNEKCAVGQSCAPLENFVRETYTVVEEREFYLEKVRLLRKKE